MKESQCRNTREAGTNDNYRSTCMILIADRHLGPWLRASHDSDISRLASRCKKGSRKRQCQGNILQSLPRQDQRQCLRMQSCDETGIMAAQKARGGQSTQDVRQRHGKAMWHCIRMPLDSGGGLPRQKKVAAVCRWCLLHDGAQGSPSVPRKFNTCPFETLSFSFRGSMLAATHWLTLAFFITLDRPMPEDCR